MLPRGNNKALISCLMEPDVSKFDEMLRDHGLRPTRARCRIMELFQQPHFHPSADEVEALLAERGEPISTATLYQNLNKLADVGLLDRFTGPDGLTRFDANRKPHHHLLCEKCSTIVDVIIDGPALTRLKLLDHRSKKKLRGYHVKTARIEFKGVCPDCRKER